MIKTFSNKSYIYLFILVILSCSFLPVCGSEDKAENKNAENKNAENKNAENKNAENKNAENKNNDSKLISPGNALKSLGFELINDANLLIEKIPPQEIIFTSKNTWEEFWSQYGQGTIPTIDFENDIVIGIFEGPKPNPGYGVKVTEVVEKDSLIQVNVTEYRENPDMMYATVMVYPYQIIKIKKLNKKIIFNRIIKVDGSL